MQGGLSQLKQWCLGYKHTGLKYSYYLPKVTKVIEAYCRSYIWSGANEITKKALVSWSRMCLPVATGGLHIFCLKIWNKAAVTKLCWDLSSRVDSLWIRWIHTYYVKDLHFDDMLTPQQASWMVRKKIYARDTLQHIQGNPRGQQSRIQFMYLQLLGNHAHVPWKYLMSSNQARLKARFTLWVHLHGHLNTADRLSKWGLNVNTDCVMCGNAAETNDHLFQQCSYAQSLWGRILQWLDRRSTRVTNGNEMREWIWKQTKGKSVQAGILKMVYTEHVHALWIERNNFQS